MTKTLGFTIRDGENTRNCEVSDTTGSLILKLEGHDFLVVEQIENHVRVVVWADPNQTKETHVIDLVEPQTIADLRVQGDKK